MKLPAIVKKSLYGAGLVTVIFNLAFAHPRFEKPKVLVFSKTEGFRHQSIEAGKSAFGKDGC